MRFNYATVLSSNQTFEFWILLVACYISCFPSQMSEKEFWTKYSRAEYLHSTKNIVAAAAEAAEDEELAVFLKQDDMLVSEARRKVFHQIFTFSLFSNKFHPKRTSTEYSGFPLLSLSLSLSVFPWEGMEGEELPEVFTFFVLFRSEEWIQLWTWKQMKVMIICISRYFSEALFCNAI